MKSFLEFCEETTSGSVSGLGFNTGNPAATDDEMQKYITTNELAKDKENGFLSKYLQNNQSKIAKKIGFNAFDPMKDHKKGKK